MKLAVLAPLLLVSASSPQTAPPQDALAVRIYYDAMGTPHVFAETDEAALYGLGYQQMRDNPIGTLDRIWRWSGHFAELVGPSYLDEDYQIRLWQVPEVAERHLREMPRDVRRMLAAYVRGVEDARAWWRDGHTPASDGLRLREVLGTVTDPDHVELNVDPLPDYLNQGFHPFPHDPRLPGGVHKDYDPVDVPAYITRIVDLLFDPASVVTLEDVIRSGCAFSSGRELLYRANEIVSVPDDDQGASNAWMISSAATGGPTVVHIDPHALRNNLRARYYLVQVQGKDYRLTGVSKAGVPVLITGANDSIAWSVTNTGVNIAVTKTSWEATLEPEGPLRFRFDGPRTDEPRGARARITLPVTRVPDAFRYFDPVATTDTDGNGEIDAGERVFRLQPRSRFYTPEDPALGVPRDRHTVTDTHGLTIDGMEVVPRPGDVIRFQQSAFVTSEHPYVFYLLLGRTRRLDGAPDGNDVRTILDRHLWSFTSKFHFADHRDRFYYVYKTKVPIQGPGVAARVAPEDYERIQQGSLALDGTRADERWQGFFGLERPAGDRPGRRHGARGLDRQQLHARPGRGGTPREHAGRRPVQRGGPDRVAGRDPTTRDPIQVAPATRSGAAAAG